MLLTREQKKGIIDLYKMIDAKQLEIDTAAIDLSKADPIKMFKFGSYNGMQIASEIIKAIPEETNAKSNTTVS